MSRAQDLIPRFASCQASPDGHRPSFASQNGKLACSQSLETGLRNPALRRCLSSAKYTYRKAIQSLRIGEARRCDGSYEKYGNGIKPTPYFWCGRQDLNLHELTQDPKSCASANSATPADKRYKNKFARDGLQHSRFAPFGRKSRCCCAF